MTSKKSISPSFEVNKVSKMKGLVGNIVQKDYKFMSETIKIKKLMVAQVLEVQAKAKAVQESQSEEEGLDLMKMVIKMSAEGADELSDDDFRNMPLQELSKLSDEIMEYSGLQGKVGK
jgi:hypothetical protein